jgi:hypothetical protein
MRLTHKIFELLVSVYNASYGILSRADRRKQIGNAALYKSAVSDPAPAREGGTEIKL